MKGEPDEGAYEPSDMCLASASRVLTMRPASKARCVAIALAVWLGAAAGAPPAAAQDEAVEARLVRVAGLDPDGAAQFFEALRQNVGTGNREAACAMVAFPLPHPSGAVGDPPRVPKQPPGHIQTDRQPDERAG